MHGEQQMLYHDQYQNVLFCEFTHDVEWNSFEPVIPYD